VLPVSKDSLTPATKRDLRDLEKRLDAKIDRLAARVDRLDRRINSVERRLRADMKNMKDEILRHFDLTVETIRHDLLGANRDEIGVIKDRVTRLEKHTGLVAA